METIKIEKIYNSFKREEFVEYFKSIGTTEDEIIFQGEGWRAFVHDEEKKLKWKIEFTCVKIDLEIKADLCEEFTDRLRKTFLRGGG